MSIEDRSWMYEGWNDNGCHSQDWVRNTEAFLDHAFSGFPNAEKTKVACPCSECRNRVRWRRGVMSMHLCKRGFMPGYTVWTEHGEHSDSVPMMEQAYNTTDGLDEMLGDYADAMDTGSVEEKPTADAKAAMLSASQEPIHDFTSVSRLTAASQFMDLMSQHNLSEESINSLLRLLDDVFPENHKLPKNVSECKNLLRVKSLVAHTGNACCSSSSSPASPTSTSSVLVPTAENLSPENGATLGSAIQEETPI